MSRTLEQMLSDFGMDDKSQTKTASAAPAAGGKSEVDQVIESLGLAQTPATQATEQTKTASAATQERGSAMSDFTSMYEEVFGTEGLDKTAGAAAADPAAAGSLTAAVGGQTKVASLTEVVGGVVEGNDEDATPAQLFGECVAHYFNAGQTCYLDKIAGDSAGGAEEGSKPMAGLSNSGQLAAIVGNGQDPAITVNHKATGGGKVETNGSTAKRMDIPEVTAQAMLKRKIKAQAGDVGAYHQT